MTAYYNEFDPKAAAWLRELIRQGHIAPGDVDERSIADVTPDDLRGYVQCHFFAGIGVWSYALRRAGWSDDRPIWTGSCPCQPFSAAGKGGGFDDERHLWPHFHWLIDQCRPDDVVGEQVASKDGLAWIDLVQADLEGSGYASGALDFCSAGVGAPHIRQRLYWFGERLEHAASDRRLERWAEPGRRSFAGGRSTSWLADAERERGRSGQSGREDAGNAGVAGETSRLADPDNAEWRPNAAGRDIVDGSSPRRPQGASDVEGRVGAGWLADTNGTRPAPDTGNLGQIGGVPQAERQPEHGASLSGRSGEFGGMANSSISRRDEAGQHERGPSQLPARPAEHGGVVRPTGPTGGLWRDADWLRCRDERWRPVEPGTFPLAHGAPARVGRLRGYGNAINAEAATVFIESYLEAKAAQSGRNALMIEEMLA